MAVEALLEERIAGQPETDLVGALREDPEIGRAWFNGSPVISPRNGERIREIADKIIEAELGAATHDPPDREVIPTV
jgi:hypothetical protein